MRPPPALLASRILEMNILATMERLTPFIWILDYLYLHVPVRSQLFFPRMGLMNLQITFMKNHIRLLEEDVRDLKERRVSSKHPSVLP